MDDRPLEDLITPERFAKGDLEIAYNIHGKISRAIPSQLTIAKDLVRRGVFPYHYEIYGVGFLELSNAFRAPWAAKSGAVMLEQWGVGVSVSDASGIYQTVCRRMTPVKINVLNYVLNTNERRKGKPKLANTLKCRRDYGKEAIYKDCFELLASVMDEEREKVYRKNHL